MRVVGELGRGAEHGAPPTAPSLLASSQPIVGILCVFSLGINLSPNRGAAYAPIFQASLHLSDALSSLGVTKLFVIQGGQCPLVCRAPGGRGWAGAWPRWRMGFPCEMRREDKLLPEQRFAQAGARSRSSSGSARLSLTFPLSGLNIKGGKWG